MAFFSKSFIIKSFFQLLMVLALIQNNFISGMPSALACTVFQLNNTDQVFVAKGYDFDISTAYGVINTSGRKKIALLPPFDAIRYLRRTLRWTAKYASLSFTQNVQEVAISGMNEKGLVVELLDLLGTQYPDPQTSKDLKVISEGQIGQYLLDSAATVEEVIYLLKKLAIDKFMIELHLFVCDANKNCAAIEYLDKKLVVHSGANMPIRTLTNTTYSKSIDEMSSAMPVTELRNYSAHTQEQRSLLRFNIASSLNQAYDGSTDPVEYSFSVLEAVRVNNPAQKGEEGREKTQWNIVYDQIKKIIYFKSTQAPIIKALKFENFNFSCTTKAKFIDLNQFGKLGGLSNSGIDIQESDFSYFSLRKRYQMLSEFEKVPFLVEILMPVVSGITRCAE